MSDISQAMAELREDDLKALVQDGIKAGASADDILKGCQDGLAQVGDRFEKGEYFISELMYAGEIMKDLMKDLGPLLKDDTGPGEGVKNVVLGTVAGDIHDIGKDIVALMLRASGYHVIDLGVDVPAEKFAEAVKEHTPIVVGMSVFLTTCSKAIGEALDAIKATGLRDSVTIMIGGAAASDFVAERTGCDCYGATAIDAVSLTAKAAGG